MSDKPLRGSVLDLFLVLLLLCAATGAALRWIDQGSTAGTEIEAALFLSANALPQEVADCLTVGDLLYTADGTTFGVLTEIITAPARITLEQNGIFYVGETADAMQVDLRLHVEVRGTEGSNGFLLNGRTALPIGKSLTLYTERAAIYASVASESILQ